MSAIESLLGQGAMGFIFDVRTNPGGLVSETHGSGSTTCCPPVQFL